MPNSSSKSLPVSLVLAVVIILMVFLILFTGAGNWIFSFFKGDIDSFGLFSSQPPVSQDVADLPLFDYSGEIHTLSGRSVPVSAMKNKNIFIHFWATWCPPCIKELPDIDRLFNEMKDVPNLHFVMVANESQEKVQEFMRQKKYRFPVYLSQQFLYERMHVTGIPSTFIIDSTGRVVFKFVGSANWDDENFRDYLRAMPAQKQ